MLLNHIAAAYAIPGETTDDRKNKWFLKACSSC